MFTQTNIVRFSEFELHFRKLNIILVVVITIAIVIADIILLFAYVYLLVCL